MHTIPGLWVPSSGAVAPDLGRMAVAVERIVGDRQPRVVDSEAAAAGRERIVALFAEAGVALESQEVHLLRSRAGEVRLTNLVGRIPGTRPGTGAFAIAAHSDSVPGSPGAGDDAAGVAAVLEVAHAFRREPPARDAVILITDGEEAGLLGAEVFMRSHPWAAELTGVVNLDARGASGPAFVFELGPETGHLVPRMARHLAAPRTTSLASWIYERMPNGTDFTIFRRAGLTGYNVAFIGDFAAYHTPEDTPERLNRSTLRHMGHAALALARALDSMERTEAPPPEDARDPAGPEGAAAPEPGAPAPQPIVTRTEGARDTAPLFAALVPDHMAWTDLGGVCIVRWPTTWGPGLALLAAVAALAPLVARAVREAPRGRPFRGIGVALGALLACALLAAGLGIAAREGAAWAGVDMRSAPGRTTGVFVLLVAAGGVLVVTAGAWLAGRRHAAVAPSAGLAAVWIAWAVLATVSAFLLPAAAPLAIVPLMAAGLGALATAWAGTRTLVATAALAGLAGTVVVWFPLEPAFLDALGLQLAPVAGARAVLVLAPLMALAMLAGHGARAAGRLSN
jgi:hypothetical protein